MDKDDKDFLLDQAKMGLMYKKNSTFIATILFSLKFSWDESIPTACTNGINLLINPNFFKPLTVDERIFLLAHEAWHVAFQHMCRVGDRDFKLWNQATDYVINLMLKDAGYSLIKGGLLDEKFRDMNSDQVYAHLLNNAQDSDPNFQPDMQPAEDSSMSQAQKDAVEQQIINTINKATMQSKASGDAPGSIPGEIEVALHDLLYPKLSWNEILNRFMNDLNQDDYSFAKVNRRFLPDVYLPTLVGERLSDIASAVDTSCSVLDHQFTEFVTELDEIKTTLNPEKMTIIDFDTSIKKVQVLEEYDDLSSVKFHGRGGTDIREVLKWAKENKPACLIIFTDGEFRQHNIDPGIPVFWIIHSNCYGRFSYPFGQVIEYPH